MEMQRQETRTAKEKNRAIRDFIDASIRAVEGEGRERTFRLSFSSEEPVQRWYGQEILDHTDGCVDLDRLNEFGILLFNHDRNYIAGKVERAWIEDGRGCAEVTFDSDEEAEKIYQKVKSGTLKGVSVGYRVEDWEEVMPNKMSSDGRFAGPCSIAKKWAPLEISIVSIPADPTVGVGRDMQDGDAEPLDDFERQLQINKNLLSLAEGGKKS